MQIYGTGRYTLHSPYLLIAFWYIRFFFLKKTQKEWQVVFIITSVIYLIGFVVYTLFSESETQPWALNNVAKKDEDAEEKAHMESKESTIF